MGGLNARTFLFAQWFTGRIGAQKDNVIEVGGCGLGRRQRGNEQEEKFRKHGCRLV